MATIPPVEEARKTVLTDSIRFGIPAHIHVCVTAAGSVILDVNRDKYLGLGREATELLADAVAGWPEPPWQRSPCHDRSVRLEAERTMCDPLVADGVLERVSDPMHARVVRPLKDMRREWVSIGDELEVLGSVTLGRMALFLAAYCWARYSLAWRPLSKVVDEVRIRKLRGVEGSGECEIGGLAAMVDVFRRLRPLAFEAEGHCLLHALTLVRFLSHYRLYPEWVIGVKTHPWGAHSWVEQNEYLLDSNPEKVCGYTPIMIV